VTPAGRIETVAGTGWQGFSGDGGPAVGADLNHPLGVAVDFAGNLYIADADNHRVRAVASDGVIRTIAGDGTQGFTGDGGAAASARLNFPSGVAAGPDGEIYIADSWNHRVRKLTPAMAAPVQAEPLIALRVVHAASLVAGPIAPGQLVTILGVGLGTALSLGDAQVLFDGTPTPVLSVQDDQIQVQAPYGIARQTATVIEVQVRQTPRGRASVPVTTAAPGLFTLAQGKGPALAVNEDGTLNTDKNPAARGSAVVLYATGEGVSRLPVAVSVGGYAAEVLFAGAASGFPGLMQVNLRLPSASMPSGVLPLTLTVGAIASQPGVTLAVR
jgi:uncharacterized protein (TIGR03437 family)